MAVNIKIILKLKKAKTISVQMHTNKCLSENVFKYKVKERKDKNAKAAYHNELSIEGKIRMPGHVNKSNENKLAKPLP